MDTITHVGHHIYQLHRWKEQKRYLWFRFRCWWHKKTINKYLKFFEANPLRAQLPMSCPALIEQVTRSFFYHNSTLDERIALVERHIEILEAKCTPDTVQQIYVNNKPVIIWTDNYEDKPLTLELHFGAGQRKEGCLSLNLIYENRPLYQIMFWLGGATETPSVYIGALQGIANGEDLIKNLTKAYFGYRTKNLIFYGLRAFARELGCDAIYAVTNEGYYAMNGIRVDRKLKTDFAKFWAECEGEPAEDKRFYKIPIAEHRKSMEELKPSKRAQHRRRFEKLDAMDAQIHTEMQKVLN